MITPDLLFSYWIYVWFILFYFTKQWSLDTPIPNPHLVFWIALIENLITWIFLVQFHAKYSILLKYLFIILLIKGIPLYLMRKIKVHWIQDLENIVIVFAIYNAYLWLRSTNIIEVYLYVYKSVVKGSSNTPLFAALNAMRL